MRAPGAAAALPFAAEPQLWGRFSLHPKKRGVVRQQPPSRKEHPRGVPPSPAPHGPRWGLESRGWCISGVGGDPRKGPSLTCRECAPRGRGCSGGGAHRGTPTQGLPTGNTYPGGTHSGDADWRTSIRGHLSRGYSL